MIRGTWTVTCPHGVPQETYCLDTAALLHPCDACKDEPRPLSIRHQDMRDMLADQEHTIAFVSKVFSRLRAVHVKIHGPADDTACQLCSFDENSYYEYPCPTIRILNGEEL